MGGHRLARVSRSERLAPRCLDRVEGSRRWWILAAMTGTLSMMMLDATVVSVALPSIQADLDMGQTELQWVVNAYLLALAAFVAVAGRISDMFNRVGVLIAGVGVFVVCSALCGLAQSDAWLIAARALQGLGAALMIPPTATIVTNTFGVEERGRAMGIYAGLSMIFLSLGPLIGGVFTESLDWRWVFWINIPVGAATIAMVIWTKPRGPRGGRWADGHPGPRDARSGAGRGRARADGGEQLGLGLAADRRAARRRHPPVDRVRGDRAPRAGAAGRAAPVRRAQLPGRHARPVLRPVRADRAHDLRRDLHPGHPRLHADRGRARHAADHAAAAGGRAAGGPRVRPRRSARDRHRRHALGGARVRHHRRGALRPRLLAARARLRADRRRGRGW